MKPSKNENVGGQRRSGEAKNDLARRKKEKKIIEYNQQKMALGALCAGSSAWHRIIMAQNISALSVARRLSARSRVAERRVKTCGGRK